MTPVALAVLTLAAVGLLAVLYAERARTVNKEFLLNRLDAYAAGRAGKQPVGRRLQQPLGQVESGIAALLISPKKRAELRLRLARAGMRAEADLEAALKQKVRFGGLALLFALLMSLSSGLVWLFFTPGIAYAAFMLPDLLVYNRQLNRADEIARSLADSIDLLRMCVEAGLSFEGGLARVAEMQAGPLADEFGAVLTELQVGKSRAEALGDLALRNPQEELRRFVSSVQQVDRLGIPIAVVLEEQSNEMRSARSARAREKAQKLPIKLLAPIMICFMPGIFIIVLGPAMIAIVQAFSNF